MFPDGRERFVMFNVLLFGLSTAQYILPKFFKAAGQVLGVQCFHCEVYLDPASNPMKGDLCASGFVINESKSIRTLFKKLDWPGVTLDCGNGTISIKQSRAS